jgi:hypothetical protein
VSFTTISLCVASQRVIPKVSGTQSGNVWIHPRISSSVYNFHLCKYLLTHVCFRTSRLAGRNRNVVGSASPVRAMSFSWTILPAKHVLPDICQMLTRQVSFSTLRPRHLWLLDWLDSYLVFSSVVCWYII